MWCLQLRLTDCSCLQAAWASELLRFTALLQTTVVVVVWWAVIVPLIVFHEKSPAKRRIFLRWNCSFALINVHLLNLPVAALDFLSAPRALTPMDLWIALSAAFVYIVFYTLVLDRNGVFLYFMFTPRTHWCVVVWSLTLALLAGILAGWAALGGYGMTGLYF